MKKVGARILLCLMLVIALVTSTLTAFAEPNTTNGLDLSKFKTVELKEVAGSDGEAMYMKNGLKYLFLYKDDDKFYRYVDEKVQASDSLNGEIEYEDTKVLKEIPISDVTDFINNPQNYSESYYVGDGEYVCIQSISELKQNCKDKSFYAFFCKGDELYNAGYYNSFDDVIKSSELGFSLKLPELQLSVEKGESSANIKVDFKCESGVSSVICRYSDGTVMQNYTVPDSDIYGGSCTFEVTTNEKFTIEAYNNFYYSVDEEHTSQEVEINGLVANMPKFATSTDSKAPKITFSKLPKSALTNSEVEVTMYSNEPARLVFNGQASDGYVKKMKVKVKCNGKYTYSATDKSSNLKDGKLNIKFFKDAEGFDDANRDNFWNNPNSPISAITSKLPQTGSVGWYWMIAFGVALVGVGGFVVFKATKSRKNKGIENK